MWCRCSIVDALLISVFYLNIKTRIKINAIFLLFLVLDWYFKIPSYEKSAVPIDWILTDFFQFHFRRFRWFHLLTLLPIKNGILVMYVIIVILPVTFILWYMIFQYNQSLTFKCFGSNIQNFIKIFSLFWIKKFPY